MRRRILIGPLVLFAALIAGSPAFGSTARLTPSGGATFPARSYVLTVPAGASPTTSGIRILENGQPVNHPRVRRAGARFAVLLVIDASTSMRGAAIQGAMAAARAFAHQRPADQALGVVTFNNTPDVLLAPTTNAAAISSALAGQPTLHGGTHIYDALRAGLDSISSRRFDAAAVVLLSDGHDYGSATTSSEVADATRRAHAKLFTVGLRSASFDPSTLQTIAASGSGEYLGAVRPGSLSGLYRSLGSELSAAYVIRYVSSAASGAAVQVVAEAGQERAEASYAAPRLHVPGGVAPRPTISAHGDKRFLGSRAGAAVVALIVLALAFLGTAAILEPRRHRNALRQRISQYGTAASPLEAGEFTSLALGEARSERPGWITRLEYDLELGRLNMSYRRYLAQSAAFALLMGIVVAAVTGNGALAILTLLVAAPLAVWLRRRHAVARQRARFGEQLAEGIEAATSAMRTGHSFAGALTRVVESAPEPLAGEFRRVIADERLGVPLEVALERITERMRNKDLQQVALVSVIQRETGGNGAEALDRVVENVRARDELRRLVRTLTAQGRTAQAVLSALPVATLIMLKVVGGSTMDPLFHSGLGHAMLVLAALLVATGGMWIGRIVKIRV